MKFISGNFGGNNKKGRKRDSGRSSSSKPGQGSSKSMRTSSKAASVKQYAPSLPKPSRKPSVKQVSGAVPKSAPNDTRGRVREDVHPVIRLRTVLIGLCALAACMVGPLALVWKQSYINQISITLENRAEALKGLNGEITSLKLEQARLSAAPRIERIALGRGLEYPSSERMVIIDVGSVKRQSDGGVGGLIARVRSFILGERG